MSNLHHTVYSGQYTVDTAQWTVQCLEQRTRQDRAVVAGVPLSTTTHCPSPPDAAGAPALAPAGARALRKVLRLNFT